MTSHLFRSIVGAQADPLLRINNLPRPYRQTPPAPLAQMKGSVADEPSEAETPITEQSSNISTS